MAEKQRIVPYNVENVLDNVERRTVNTFIKLQVSEDVVDLGVFSGNVNRVQMRR